MAIDYQEVKKGIRAYQTSQKSRLFGFQREAILDLLHWIKNKTKRHPHLRYC